MKKNKAPALLCPVPEGYYVPTNKKAQRKKWNTINFFLLCFIIPCIFIIGSLSRTICNALGADIQTFFLQLQPYDKTELQLSGDTKAVDAAYFHFTIPADYEEVTENAHSIHYGKQVGDLNYSILAEKKRISFSEKDFAEDFSPSGKAKINQSYEEILGYSPLDSNYAMCKAPYDIHLKSFFPLSKERLYICNSLIIQKSVMASGFDTVYHLDTPTYCGFAQVMKHAREKHLTLNLQLYTKEDLNTSYHIIIQVPEERSEEAFAILNSIEFLPNLDALAQQFEEEYEQERAQEVQNTLEGQEEQNLDSAA